MENKLEQLTQKLYDEGLAKGRKDAEKLVAEAESKAARLVKDAESRAQNIVSEAETKAEELRKNTLSEVALAARQAVAQIKDEISSLIVARSIASGVHSAGLDPDFIKQMLLEVAHGWSRNADGDSSSGGKVSLEVLLPEARRKELDAAFSQSASELLAAGIEVGYSPEVRTGFRVGTKDGGYYIGFSDENLEALLSAYLRPGTSKLLFDKA